MSRIERLTPEQEARLPVFREEWLRVGMQAGPVDRALAEPALKRAYAVARKPLPLIIYCASPAACSLEIPLFERDSLGESLWESLRASLWDSLGASLRASLRESLRESLGASLRASLGESLGESLGASLGASLRESLGASTFFWGQHDAYWVAFYSFCRDIGVAYAPNANERLDLMADLCRSCGWIYFYQNACFVAARPTVKTWVDSRGVHRLHCEDGPAMRFEDGFAIWAWRGVRVPQQVIEKPNNITPDEIFAESNAEIRRVMIERYGRERLLSDGRVSLVDSDPDNGATYHRVDLGDGVEWGLLGLTCSTTGKHTVIWARPDHGNCREALAASFKLARAEDYNPAIQT